MSTDTTDADEAIKKIIAQLQVPVSDLTTLLALLSGPLDCLGLLPPKFRHYIAHPLPKGSVIVKKHIPLLQRALLEHIIPTWDTILAENDAESLLEQYFCPNSLFYASPVAGELAMSAYSSIVSLPFTVYGMGLLNRLIVQYPVERMHVAAFGRTSVDPASKNIDWEDYIRNITIVPPKVANAVGAKATVHPSLEHGAYFNNLCVQCERLIYQLSNGDYEVALPSVVYLLMKLVNLGVFPRNPPISRSQPSFFGTLLPKIRSRLKSDSAQAYSACWNALFQSIPFSLASRSILSSLFASLSTIDPPTDTSPSKRATVKQEARLLVGIVGNLSVDNQELWESATSLITGRDWDESYARVFVCWASGGALSNQINLEVLSTFAESVLDTWTSPEHIKHSLLSHHRYVTSLLLIAVSYFLTSSKYVQTIAFSSKFIKAIGDYIAHLDKSIRRCGMLVAEVIAQYSGKSLDFGDWTGDDSGKSWARALRKLLETRDVDVDVKVSVVVTDETETEGVALSDFHSAAATHDGRETFKSVSIINTDGYDSDDSITGYASVPSSRSASPTPSELAEIEKDPSLNVGVKKVARPVYLAQLGNLIRGPDAQVNTNEPHEADKIEMALNVGEELIRKKRGYGSELDENSVDLVHGFLALHNKYELEDFDIKRQGVMNALIACAPRKATPALIQEFFKNQYSTEQRFVSLNALALGGRELASLPVPPSRVYGEKTSFPSKKLPEPLHRKYIAAGQANTRIVPLIVNDISKQALSSRENQIPPVVRERRLRINKPPMITELTLSSKQAIQPTIPSVQPTVAFTEVAAEYFIMPLINRFWLFLRDEQTREERTSQQEGRHRYYGAGTGLILNPIVLSHFLQTLAILTNASQNAPAWLGVIVPETLELAVMLGTRPVSHLDADSDDESHGGTSDVHEKVQVKQASVLASALELALVVLTGCLELDSGRVLCLEHTALLLGTKEWAEKVISSLDKGMKAVGGGGLHEIRLKSAAAGVVLKADELTSKWRRSMLEM